MGKSLMQKYKEASSEDIIKKVVILLLAEFFTMVMHTFWGSMFSPTNRIWKNDSLNRTIHPEEWRVDYVVSALAPAFQAGFAAWMFIVLFWKICVINFNPAISTALLISGDLSPWLYLPYVAMQVLGSYLGALIAQSIKSDDNIGPFLISDDANVTAILTYEIMVTGIMCFFTNVMVGDKSYDQPTGALAIGMTVFQGILAGRWIGGGCMNPARAIGPALVLGGSVWKHHWVWWTGDIVGAIVFALIYRSFFAPPDKVWIIQVQKIFRKPSEARTHASNKDEENVNESRI